LTDLFALIQISDSAGSLIDINVRVGVFGQDGGMTIHRQP